MGNSCIVSNNKNIEKIGELLHFLCKNTIYLQVENYIDFTWNFIMASINCNYYDCLLIYLYSQVKIYVTV